MRSRKFSIHYSKFRMTKSGRGLRSARTSRREQAGLRRAKLRPAAASRSRKFSIQNYCSGRGLRRSRTTARSCGPPLPQAAARRPLAGSNLTASPQPSGGACDVKEQPSARRRLRAAGRSATDLDTRDYANKQRLRAAGRSATAFAGKHFLQNQRLRAAATSCEAAN